MKKFFVMAVMAVAALSANAQYAPEKGDFSTAIKFNPFHSSGKTFEAVDDYAIMGRYMITDNDGIRLTLGLGYTNDFDKVEKEFNNVKSEYELNDSKTSFSIKAGYERHFSANDRIDLYAGAQVGFATTSTNKESVEAYTDKDFKQVPFVAYTKGGANTVSLGVFTGINFYVYKKLFVGAELGFNYAHASNKDVEAYTVNKDGDGTEVKTTPNNATSTALGFKVEPQLTLGWTF